MSPNLTIKSGKRLNYFRTYYYNMLEFMLKLFYPCLFVFKMGFTV